MRDEHNLDTELVHVRTVTAKVNKGKAASFDSLTAEHLLYFVILAYQIFSVNYSKLED